MLIDILQSNRPKLSDNTLKTYQSIINSLYRKMHMQREGDTDTVYKFFTEEPQKVLEYLKNVPPSNRKTMLAALVVLCIGKECIDTYRNQMLKDAEVSNKHQRLQQKTDTQKESWIKQTDVLKLYRSLERKVSPLWKKTDLTKKEMDMLQDYVILSLYVLIPPRRLMDYTQFKVRNINKETDNYMEKRTFVFNKYKTANKYHRQEVDIPQRLVNIVKRWSNLHNSDHLLVDDNGKPFSSPKLTLRLNRIFGGRKISVNQLRHTYITDNVLNHVPALQRLEEVASDMGHSVDQAMLYKKIDK